MVNVSIGTDKYKSLVVSDHHELIADEPKPIGTDLGPNPYQFLLIALGSCVAMTLRMYADRKGWDLQQIEVQLSQTKIHAEDCTDCESTTGYVQVIKKQIQFKGDLDEKQVARLMEISNRCPVQKTLINEIKVETELMG
jgi:putative redox protein